MRESPYFIFPDSLFETALNQHLGCSMSSKHKSDQCELTYNSASVCSLQLILLSKGKDR